MGLENSDGPALFNRTIIKQPSYHNILKLARIIADLAGEPDIQTLYIAETVEYRDQQQVSEKPKSSGCSEIKMMQYRL